MAESIRELTVGDTAYVEPIRNMKQHGVQSCIIRKIGRKWLHVRYGGFILRFNKETGEGANEGGMAPEWRLWPSKQAYLDETERQEIIDRLGKAFAWPNRGEGLSLERLRDIEKIVFPTEQLR